MSRDAHAAQSAFPLCIKRLDGMEEPVSPSFCQKSPTCGPPLKTGWPAPALMQDDDRKLFRWFASRLDARQRVREAAAAILN